MSPPHALLLLPEPPQHPSLSNIRLALYPPISMALKKLQRASSTTTSSSPKPAPAPASSAILDIALPVSRLATPTSSPTLHSLFNNIHQLLTSVFKLLTTISYRESVSEGIDARLILVYGQAEEVEESVKRRLECCAVDFADLARSASSGAWTHLFAVESEQGEGVWRKFRKLVEGGASSIGQTGPGWEVQRVEGGMQLFNPKAQNVAVGQEALPTDLDLVGREVWVLLSGGNEDRDQKLTLEDKYALAVGRTLLNLSTTSSTENESQAFNNCDLGGRTLHVALVNPQTPNGLPPPGSTCTDNDNNDLQSQPQPQPQGVYQKELAAYLLATNSFNPNPNPSRVNSTPSHSTVKTDGNSSGDGKSTVSITKRGGRQVNREIYHSVRGLEDQEREGSQPAVVVVVSRSFKVTVARVNRGRKEKGLKELEVLELGDVRPGEGEGESESEVDGFLY